MHDIVQQLLSYLKAAWRYRWYAAGMSWLVAVAGWIGVAQMPNRYEASARVFVDTQSVLRPLLGGLAVQPNINQTVSMMGRTLITRPNVDKVVRMADMDVYVKTPEEREQLITRLTKQLTIKSAGLDNLYTIAYSDPSPDKAKRVVQSLLTIFVESSLGSNRRDADAARKFIDEQLHAYNEKLVAAENAVTEFKRQHLGLLGGEGQNYYSRMTAAQAAVSQAALELKEAENSRDAIKRQLLDNEAMPTLIGEQTTSEPVNPEIDARIRELEKQLDSLRLRYTEQHPDIVSTIRMINQLKEEKKKEASIKKPAAVQAAQARNPVHQQLSFALAEAEANVASMRARVAEYERRLNALKAAANAIPQYEAQYKQLTRDYEVTKKNYDGFLARRESIQISQEMEAKANVVDFRVIDPPQVPSTPNAPNRPLLISMVLLAALGAGAAFAFLMSQIRPTIGDERRLREVSGLPVFGTVVMAWTDTQVKKRRRALAAFFVSLLSLLSAYAAVMAVVTLSVARS